MLSDRSLDDSTKEDFSLELQHVRITPRVLSALVQILNRPSSRNQNGKDPKWDKVWFEKCCFARACTVRKVDLLHAFMAALLTRTKQLTLLDSPDIVACLWGGPKLELEMNSLSITAAPSGSTIDYIQLGEVIQRSAHLNELYLHVPFGEVPGKMIDSLADATSLKELNLRQRHRYGVVGESGDRMLRLLQNPQSLLRHLSLAYVGLENRHFITMAQLLPTSQLEFLDVSHNNVQPQGILEFAKQLPRIKTLKKIAFQNNPWLSESRYFSQRDECFLALVQGMMENYSVEDLDVAQYNDSFVYMVLGLVKVFEHRPPLIYLMDLNRAGRRILPASTFIPSGLWPFVLKRAGTPTLYPSEWYIGACQRARSANAVYSLLRSCPIVWHRTR
jgi:hypothetical protein